METTLWSLGICQNAKVSSIAQDLDASLALRLSEIGFEHGQMITCIKNSKLGGPKVYRAGTNIFALEKELAEKICVVI